MSVPWYLMAKGKGGVGYKTASGPIVSVNDALAAPLRSLVANIEPVQEGSGDPSPDNVRPISGWSEVKVWRTGKNLLNSTIPFDDGIFYDTNSDGSITVYATDTRAWDTSRAIYLKKGTYIASRSNSGGTCQIRDLSSDIGIAYMADGVYVSNAFTLVTDAFVGFRLSGAGSYPYVTTFQLELGSTATAYSPYSGNQYTIQLGQTVYGGSLDVTNGVLTVDRASVTVDGSDAFTYQANGHTDYSTRAYIPITGKKYGINNMISDKFVYAALGDFYGKMGGRANTIGVEFFLPPEVPNVSADIKQWFADNHTQVVYELATPITIPLTATQISTLQGQNNLWADSGDVTVEYLSSGGANADLMKLAVAFMGRR